jgi:hypothetical protein
MRRDLAAADTEGCVVGYRCGSVGQLFGEHQGDDGTCYERALATSNSGWLNSERVAP